MDTNFKALKINHNIKKNVIGAMIIAKTGHSFLVGR